MTSSALSPDTSLLPCPFCGGTELCFRVDGVGKWGRVECGCGVCGPDVRTSYEETGWQADAAKEWNTRTPPEVAP